MIVNAKELQDGYVKTEIHKEIAAIEFHHPNNNALPSKLLFELAHEITNAGNNKDVHVIILRSASDMAFSAGTLLDELTGIETEKDGARFFTGIANVINAMRKCPKFIIARVHGKCVGSGVGIVAAADYAIAMEGADIRLHELAIGIGPYVIGPAIERKIGNSAFSQLSIDAQMWRNGDWSRRKGLYAELHPTAESMEESISRLSTALAHSGLEAMEELKRNLWRGTEHWDALLPERAYITGRLIVSKFAKEALNKLKQGERKNF